MSDETKLIERLRDRWQSDDSVRAQVAAWIQQTWSTIAKRRLVRRTIRRLWNADLPHWTGVFRELYREALEDGLEPEEAAHEAIEDLRPIFLKAVEVQLVRRMDQRVRWAFIDNPAFRDLLEKHDGTLFATLVAAARVSIQITLSAVPLIEDRREAATEELATLVSAFLVEEPDEERPTPSRKIPPRVERPMGTVVDVPAIEMPDLEIEDPEESTAVVDFDDGPDTVVGPAPGQEEPEDLPSEPSAVTAARRVAVGSRGARKRREAAQKASSLSGHALPPMPSGLAGVGS